MATNWIKVEHTMPDKPEVVQIAARLRIDQDAVAGKLIRLWVWADQNVVAERGIPVTRAFIDRLVNKKGFAAALEMPGVGWLGGDDGALELKNFSRHNGETAKVRAQTNRRVAEFRVAANGHSAAHEKPNGNGGSVTDVTRGALPKALPDEDEDKDPLNPPQAGESAASHASAKAAKPREGKMRGRRLPDLATLRENLAEMKIAIGDLRRPGGCAFDRRPEEMSEENRERLAKLCGEAGELEKMIEFVRGELGRRTRAKVNAAEVAS